MLLIVLLLLLIVPPPPPLIIIIITLRSTFTIPPKTKRRIGNNGTPCFDCLKTIVPCRVERPESVESTFSGPCNNRSSAPSDRVGRTPCLSCVALHCSCSTVQSKARQQQPRQGPAPQSYGATRRDAAARKPGGVRRRATMPALRGVVMYSSTRLARHGTERLVATIKLDGWMDWMDSFDCGTPCFGC